MQTDRIRTIAECLTLGYFNTTSTPGQRLLNMTTSARATRARYRLRLLAPVGANMLPPELALLIVRKAATLAEAIESQALDQLTKRACPSAEPSALSQRETSGWRGCNAGKCSGVYPRQLPTRNSGNLNTPGK
jgi:hypothetical protein